LSDSDEAIFTVTPVNDPPVANDDVYSLAEGGILTVAAHGVLANDTDADANDTLTTTLVSGPSHGTLTLNLDGSLVYAHDGSETTSDSFTYQACDGTDLSNIAVVIIIVNSVNDSPVAVEDSATTNEDTSVVINVLSNDSDPEGDILTVSDYDIRSTQGGTVDCISIGVCTYAPSADFNGTDTFTYTISDGNGGTDNATVTISVLAVAPPENLVYLPLILNNHIPITNVQVDTANLPRRRAPQQIAQIVSSFRALQLWTR
ncbi:MAG: Ig-like domain-containing protein, partial [Anaerolineae bacterium]